MADEDNDWVEMRHPQLGEDSLAPHGGASRVSREAFDTVWQPIGWELISAEEPEAATTRQRPTAAAATTPKEKA